MKKIIFIFLTIALMVGLTACQKQNMDQPAADSNYHYQNKDLGFGLVFPPEFIYYQTQRTNHTDYIDMEYFVPTSDPNYPTPIQSYARPVLLRIYTGANWTADFESLTDKDKYIKVGETKNRTYFLRFWDDIPSDWQSKWNDEMRQFIVNNFQIL